MTPTTPPPTPETGEGSPSFANFTIQKLERERDEAREELQQWKMLCAWGGTPEHIDQFIKGQQSRIHQAQDIEETCEQLERERDEARRNAEVERLSGVAVVAMCKRQESEIDAMREAIKEAHTELSKLLDIINNSRGVAGWHLNGDIATWDEFEINPAATITKLQPFLP